MTENKTTVERKVIKLGESYVVTLPIELCKNFGVKAGTKVKVTYKLDNSEISISLKK